MISDWDAVLNGREDVTSLDNFKECLVYKLDLAVDVVSDSSNLDLFILSYDFFDEALAILRKNNKLIVFPDNSTLYLTRNAVASQFSSIGFINIGDFHSEWFVNWPRRNLQIHDELH